MQAQSILAADLGGTHARFLLAPAGPQGFARATSLELRSADYADLETLLTAALRGLALRDAAGTQAMLAVAGPVREGRAKLTNRPWSIDAAALQQRFGFRRVGVLNDLAAAAWALSDGPADDTRELRHGDGDGRSVVISVSTGVGTAYWSRADGRAQVDAAEGGHAGFAPTDDWAVEFLHQLQRQHGLRISWERVLSGSGLAALDAQLRGGEPLAAADVAQRAQAGESTARTAVARFSRLLGAFAGDRVLAAPAPGGVWLMGGVLAGLGAAFDSRQFFEGFDDKGRLAPQLAQVRVCLTHDDRLGLRGAWVLARTQPD